MRKNNESCINISNEEEDVVQRRNRKQMESCIRHIISLYPDYGDVNVIMEEVVIGKKE